MPDHPVFSWLTETRRAWLYRVLTAVAALAVVYGLISGEQAAAWIAVGAALIGLPVAAANTRP